MHYASEFCTHGLCYVFVIMDFLSRRNRSSMLRASLASMGFLRASFFRRFRRLAMLACIVWNTFEILRVHSYFSRSSNDDDSAILPLTLQRVYIASIHWNNEIILRSHWNAAIVQLVQVLDPANVFVSVFESGSWDGTKEALEELDNQLNNLRVERNITVSYRTHLDEITAPSFGPGWIDTPRGRTELRRIPYLAKLRNLCLQPLRQLARQGRKFDKVLFLNDVVFSTDDVLRLLNTNSGHYAAACSMDFSKPPEFYDTFALRDIEGHEALMQTWPYFRSRVSRAAMKASKPVPVMSCWNGMVSMPAHSFTGPYTLMFRGIPDTLAEYHLEGSECCLVHADNPLSPQKGVFINPLVRVGYSSEAYEAINTRKGWLSSWQVSRGLWQNRWRRWTTTTYFKEWRVHSRVQNWLKKDVLNKDEGRFCLTDEMQVLVRNGWAHI